MKTKPELGFNTRLMRDAEQHLDYLEFDQLLDLAVDVCLGHPLKIETSEHIPTTEEKIIQQLGVRGLSVAFDLIAQPEEYQVKRSTNDDGKDLVNATSPLRWPTGHNSYLNPDVQQKIEAFGDALLDEAYLSLGTDVKVKIEEFKNALSDDEQIAVLEWLDKRVKALTKKADAKVDTQDEDGYFYHPIRLSPRALGQYPHNTFDPTCLGKSILTASFAHQTGARTLHGGVMFTQHQDDFENTANALWGLARHDNLGLTDLTKERLMYKADELGSHPNTGFHAASFVELKSGAWYALDPNYRASHQMREADSKRLADAYDDIYSLGSSIKGIERKIVLGNEYLLALPRAIAVILYNTEPYTFDAPRVEAMLSHQDDDLLLGSLRDYVREVVMTKDAIGLTDTPLTMDKISTALQGYKIPHDSSAASVTLLDEAIEQAINSFFLFEESPEDIASRAKQDRSYLQRKIEDIQALPYIVSANMLLGYIDRAVFLPEESYRTLEVGATNYRLGAAVLSDFATYCGDDLSYSFWTSHWSSIIPVTERLGSISETDHEMFVATNNTNWLPHVLSYAHQGGIISEFVPLQEME